MRRRHYLKRSQVIEHTTNRREFKILTTVEQDCYFDEGWHYHSTYHTRGAKKHNKEILPYQVRMYRTWKYNRKKQWKQ